MATIYTKKSGWDELDDDIKHDEQIAELMRLRGVPESEAYERQTRTQRFYSLIVAIIGLGFGFLALGSGIIAIISLVIGGLALLVYLGDKSMISNLRQKEENNNKEKK